jgi:cell division protein FtsN
MRDRWIGIFVTNGESMLFALRRTTLLSALILFLATMQLQGCSRQEGEWRRVRAEDSAAAYEDYLRRHPGGAHSEEAQDRLRALREEREWERASRLNAPEAFQQYLGAYPEGRFAAQARERLADFLLAQAPSGTPGDDQRAARGPAVAQTLPFDARAAPETTGHPRPAVADAAAGHRAGPNRKPAGDGAAASRREPAPAVRKDVNAGANHRLQLGAFAAGEQAARRAWERLHRAHGDLLGSLTPQIDTIKRNGRTLWRLRAGPVDGKRARELCSALRSRGAACVVSGP